MKLTRRLGTLTLREGTLRIRRRVNTRYIHIFMEVPKLPFFKPQLLRFCYFPKTSSPLEGVQLAALAVKLLPHAVTPQDTFETAAQKINRFQEVLNAL